MIMVTTLLRLQTLIAPLSSCAKTVTLSSTGSVKQLPRGVKNEHGPMSKQAPGESYQGATTFFSMALAKTLILFPTGLSV